MPLKILLVDDTPNSLKQLEIIVRKLGHVPVLARDGKEALRRFQEESPDLVIMDIMMPGMDGITVTRKLREMNPERWTPVVFYSALDRMHDIIRGLESGGDDYLVKPTSVQLIRAKIGAYERMINLQNDRLRFSQELSNWRANAEQEAMLGAHVMARLTDAQGMRDPLLKYFNIPVGTFSGDLLCCARAPDGVINALLADATGHGLSAALTAMPIAQAFYSMTAKGFPLASIAEEINRKLRAILPADRFVAGTLASVDIRNQTLEVWNGGNPDALFINQAGEITMSWPSRHPPLGILPATSFSSMTETTVFHEPGDLVLSSDGLIEAENPDGAWLNLDGVRRLLGGATQDPVRFNRFRESVLQHLQSESGRDDISCMVVHVPIEHRQRIRFAAPRPLSVAHVQDWRLDVSYAANDLRYIDVVPAVLGMVGQLNLLKAHHGALFLVVSELFNNALDHGLLGLDSATKDLDDGFDIYMKQRSERLSRLETGEIALSFLVHEDAGQAVLDITVRDSGPGFDYAAHLANLGALDANDRAYGRGIALVKNLCQQLVYSGTGNKVWVRYLLGEIQEAGEGEAG